MKSLRKSRWALLALPVLLVACGESDAPIDLRPVLDRTVAALEHVDKQVDGEVATDEQMSKFTQILEEALNQPPPVYDAHIGVNLLEDATFEGFRDDNANSVKDSGEKRIFTVEIDAEGKRLIATDERGEGTDFRAAGMGFLAGALIGNLLGRQRAAGIGSSHFANRKVSSRSSYAANRSSGSSSSSSSARSSARSGSFSSGK